MFGFTSKTEVRGQGYLGSDPDKRETGSKRQVASMNVGVGRDAQTSWFRVTVWQGLALACAEQLHAGDAVYFEGTLRVRSVQEGDIVKRYTDIVATHIGKFDTADHYNLLEPLDCPEPERQTAPASADANKSAKEAKRK